MPRGRKPIAAEIHRRNGSYVHDPGRENKRAPKPSTKEPAKPEMVKADKVASKRWDKLKRQLRELGLLSDSDVDLMELYCLTYADYRKARESVTKTGQVLVIRQDGKQVEIKRNPFSTELHRYSDRLMKLMSQMGLDPASRSRMVAENKSDKEDDPIAKFYEKLGAKNS